MSIAFWFESISAGFFENFSVSSARMISVSMLSSAARAPAYAMFFIRMRSRTPSNCALHISASGMPRYVTSGRDEPLIERPRRVVQQPAAGPELRDVLLIRRGIHRDHQIELRRARGVAVPVDADLVPGRQPLNVRRKDVLPGDRDAHPEDRLHDQAVGRGRPGAVGRRDLERELVGTVHVI